MTRPLYHSLLRKHARTIAVCLAGASMVWVVYGYSVRIFSPTREDSRLTVIFNQSEVTGQLRQRKNSAEAMPAHLTPERVDGGIMP